MQVELKITGIDGTIGLLKAMPSEIVSKRGGPVKVALRKAALVVKKEVVKNLLAMMGENDNNYIPTYTLKKSVIVTRGKKPQGINGEKYLVRFRNPTYRRDRTVTARKTGHIFEYGSIKQKPRPFIRNAARTKAQEAVNVFSKTLGVEIDKVIRMTGKTKGF